MPVEKRHFIKISSGIITSIILLTAISGFAAPPLKRCLIERNHISISGLSAGGYMAVQMHVAYAETFMGTGILAAGPYYCAEGNAYNALGRCMNTPGAPLPPASYFHEITAKEASAGHIDATSNLSGDRVWLFTGGGDQVVPTRVMDRLYEYYQIYTDSTHIAYLRDTLPIAQHAMITHNYGNTCGFVGPPYINNCDYDAAGKLLQHIYGDLNPPVNAPPGNLKTFEQTEFSDSIYLGSEGYLYVPPDCESGQILCRLHVVLHGCLQNKDKIGDQYARHSGYNEWAESNNILVLYPQTSMNAPNQCWDWWGYSDQGMSNRYHTRNGSQMAAIKAMIDRLTGERTKR
jgi:predicted peptidase